MKNVELGYTFTTGSLQKAGISRLRVYTNGSNLFTIDGVKDADPKQRSKDIQDFPLRRIFNFGIQATF
ncbi:MAG: hypothetical protein LIP05_04255 [Tannerellaceae bacterium]|nr:hypothetical protein [Tannerellaceae bacterium]